MKHRMMSLLLCGLIFYCSFSFSEFTLAGNVQKGVCTHQHTEECYQTVTACRFAADGAGEENEAQTKQDHICSEESGCVTRVLACRHEHDAQCGYFGTPKPLPVLSWEWVDDEGYLVQDEAAGVWKLALPGASKESPVTASVLAELLPAEIVASLSNKDTASLPLEWDYTSLGQEGGYEGSYSLTASLPEGYILKNTAPVPSVLVELGGAQTMEVKDETLQNHVIKDTVSPANIKINLFDYGVDMVAPTDGKGDQLQKAAVQHQYTDTGMMKNFAGMEQWNRGINRNHLLIFGDDVAHAGLWNMNHGGGYDSKNASNLRIGIQGMVNSILDSSGYPSINTGLADEMLYGKSYQWKWNWENITGWKLAGDHLEETPYYGYYQYNSKNPKNLSDGLIENWEKATGQSIKTGTESLAYLFDPSETEFKKSYLDVKGLLQKSDGLYYTYESVSEFAELDKDTNRFILYDSPGVVQQVSAWGNISGNFFPFNTGEQVFDGEQYGRLTSNVLNTDGIINHYFGMTMDVDFRQPTNGMISGLWDPQAQQSIPMNFEIGGDDDIWVFVDGVLVLDMGGSFGKTKEGSIDFSTGQVEVRNTSDGYVITSTNLKDLFAAANGKKAADDKAWRGNTFADGTEHALKVFYLERGNYNSIFATKFNLEPLQFQQIKKVDQYGDPLDNVQFEMYVAKKGENGQYTAVGDAITTLVTNEEGIAHFVEPGSITPDNLDGTPFNFAEQYKHYGHEYYILKETAPPAGYRALPVDVVLRYNIDTAMLIVENPWETGAYASFNSNIVANAFTSQPAIFDETVGDIVRDDSAHAVGGTTLTGALIVAVPMLLERESKTWKAVYGSNTTGFQTVTPQAATDRAWKEAIVTALLYQCSNADTPDWYLKWNDTIKLVDGQLTDLPGRADRYLLNNPDGDMKMVYAYIDSTVLYRYLGITTMGYKSYWKLGDLVNERVARGMSREEAVADVRSQLLQNLDNFNFLDTSEFNRSFRSSILIPNEQLELRVWKVDQDGKGRDGAMFALYTDSTCKNEVVRGTTATIGGRSGVLIFTPSPEETPEGAAAPGYAKIAWTDMAWDTYYLREVSPPPGCQLNDTVTPIHVGIYSIYADAGQPGDGITVLAGVGKLVQTMKKYAADEEVNITLRDITAYALVQPSGSFAPDGWQPVTLAGTTVPRSMNLHYGKNALQEYGLHDEDGGERLYPYFVTESGFITARVKQNWDALRNNEEGTNRNANRENLGDTDLSSLFRLSNTVVVTDRLEEEPDTGTLTISKKIAGQNLTEEQYTRNFQFTLKLENATENVLGQEFYFYGTDKAGYIRSGDTVVLHHDESITIKGLPVGTRYTVTEIIGDRAGYIPLGGEVRRGVITSAADGDAALAEYINVYGDPISFSFAKVDGVDWKTPLPGARFAMYWWSGDGESDSALLPTGGAPGSSGWMLAQEAESDANGMVSFSLPLEGTYRLIETAAPSGYVLPKGQWQFSVVDENGAVKIEAIRTVGDAANKPPAFKVEEITTEGGSERSYQLMNMPLTDLPFAGGHRTFRFALLGAGLFAAAAAGALAFSLRRRRKAGVAGRHFRN